MNNILMVYSTTDGHTLKICSRMRSILEQLGNEVTLVSIDDPLTVDLASMQKIVLGASIRYGKHAKQVYEFIDRHQALLDQRPNAFFSVNLVARKPERATPETNPYLKKFLRQITWQPRLVGLFAGKLEYRLYGFWDRNIIRLIMRITGGPTDLSTNQEFTDWQRVDEFARTIHEMA